MNVDGTMDKFKARLVRKGYYKKEGIDYFDTYALVARITTIRVLIVLASTHNLANLARAYNMVYNGKSRIGLGNSYVKQLIQDGVITVNFVRTYENLADPLTKGLNRDIVEMTSLGMDLKPYEESQQVDLNLTLDRTIDSYVQ
ncbi:hypothetical protein OROMI_013889 [Orobanche minor]